MYQAGVILGEQSGCTRLDRRIADTENRRTSGARTRNTLHPTTRTPVLKPAAVLVRVAVIAVIAVPHQPVTSLEQCSGQARPTVGMSSHLPADQLVSRVVEQPSQGR